WTLQFDCDLCVWLADVEILTVRLEPRRQHLNAQGPVGNAVKVRVTFGISFQLQPTSLLFSFSIHWMKNNARIPYWFPVVVADHTKPNIGGRLIRPRQTQ